MTWVAGGEPLEDYTQLYASSTTFGSSSLVESIGKTDLKLRIKNSANTSNWYNVNGIALSVQGNYYLINLEKKFGDAEKMEKMNSEREWSLRSVRPGWREIGRLSWRVSRRL